jgi:hypothetical protein
MSRLRTRLERLERRQPSSGGINWDNLLAQSPEEIVPDGIVNWYDLFSGPPTNEATCPIEEAIRRAGLPSPDTSRAGPTPPPVPDRNGHE